MERLRWSDQRPGERVLRVWLGGTFTYAGVQKLADPGFLSDGSTSYIGDQLEGFAEGSPIGPLLDLAAEVPEFTGIATAITEILIGVATLAGIAPAIAASVGTLLSLSLWLSASWHVYPYFLGSDSIYAVAWLAYLLSLPSVVALLVAARARTRPDLSVDDTRRTALRGGAVVAGGLVLGGLAALVGRSREADGVTATNTPAPSTSAPTTTAPTDGSTPSSTATGEIITDVATLTASGGVEFNDAAGGSAILCSLANGSAAAYSLRCTHSGCTANYNSSNRIIVCPCHGSRFDPENNGAPLNGPAIQPLTSIPVVVDGNDVRLA